MKGRNLYIRASTIAHIYPSVLQAIGAGRSGTLRSGCFWEHQSGVMQDLGYELPRIPIPRTPVNKGKKKGRSPIRLAPSPLSVPFGGKGLALIHSRGPLAAALRRSSAGLLQRIRSIGRYTLNASPLKRSTFSQSEATTSF